MEYKIIRLINSEKLDTKKTSLFKDSLFNFNGINN